MISPLNYSRQARKQINDMLSRTGVSHPSYNDLVKTEEMLARSQKFLLPKGGIWYDDPNFRALDETQKLRLPFPVVALEYQSAEEGIDKIIIIAEECDNDIIEIVTVGHKPNYGWGGYAGILLPTTNYLVRHDDGDHQFRANLHKQSYGKSISVLLSFLNILSCKNVSTQKISSEKRTKGSSKAPLQFDTYHILTVENNHANSGSSEPNASSTGRSPREHLRRGHIRHCHSGKRVWVNATVINAGKGGKIIKEYALL